MAARKKKSARKAVKKKKKTAKKKPASSSRTKRRQPESLRIRAISPGLTVNDLQRSMAFYTDVLGMVVSDRWENNGQLMGVELKAGNARLWISQDDWAKGRDRKKGEGIRLFCRTVQDVDMLATAIKGRGGRLDHDPETQSWGERDFGITDPDGFRISISSGG